MAFIKRFYGIIGVGFLIFGVFWLPKDMADWKDAAAPWKRALAHVDQNNALWVLLVLIATYIFWRDITVPIWKHFTHAETTLPIVIADGLHIECYSPQGFELNGAPLYINRFFLAVGNGRRDGSTLREVQCRIFHFGPPTICPIRDRSSSEVDIRDGEWAYFQLGDIVSLAPHGLFGDWKALTPPVRNYEHNVRRGHLNFEVTDFNGNRKYGLSGYPNDHVWELTLVVSADDTPHRQAKIIIDLAAVANPVSLTI